MLYTMEIKEKSMLLLTRNRGESVIINDDIKVTVVSVRGNQVSLGFEAPKDVVIHREEIHDKIKEGKNESSD